MSTENESLLIKPISHRQFELHALSLERGPNFEPSAIFAAYQVGCGTACGCVLLDEERGTFSTIALRRRVDYCWVCVDQQDPFSTPEQALDALSIGMRGGDVPEPLPPGTRRRAPLMKIGPKRISREFELLAGTVS